MTAGFGPNERLIGKPGSRALLQTPCLVVDRDALLANISAGIRICHDNGMTLRPHAKTHKCAAVAQLQIEHGASGICVATVGEAEALARAGVGDIHITSTFAQPAKIDRVMKMVAAGVDLRVVVDSTAVASQLAAALHASGLTMPVLIDIDMGRHRSGVTSPEAAAVIAQLIRGSPLQLRGLQGYAGHLSHEPDYSRRATGAREAAERIAAFSSALRGQGHAIDVVSGASTGTLFIDAATGCYTEMQCGSYIFMDVEYDTVDLDGRRNRPFLNALSVRTSVISNNVPGVASTDAGHKHFTGKHAYPRPTGLLDGADYRPVSDEHGLVELPAGSAAIPVGTSFECVVPHCDPTLNQFDQIHLVSGDTLKNIWTIDARGAF